MSTKIKSEADYALFLCISIKRQEVYAVQSWLDKAPHSRNTQCEKIIQYSHSHSGSVYINVFERNLLTLSYGS